MVFFENYVRLCNSVGKTPSAVALEMGIAKPTVTRWKNGSTPNSATLYKVADYFGVSTGYLLGEEEQKEKPTLQMESELKISDDDMKHLKQFHRADPATKEAIRLLLLKFSEEEHQ